MSNMSEKERLTLSRRARSFRYAFEGWWFVLRTQPNAWIHALISTAVFVVAVWLRLPGRDWAVLVLTITGVWMAEFTNTAIEAVVDLMRPEPDPLAKVAKDVSAAAVLLGAIGAVIVGLLLIGPPLWRRLFG